MLSANLGRVPGRQQVVLAEIVDRMMLGGFIVESGSMIRDGSFEGQLELMRRRLASG
jgi:F0F1-type ATP synthase delta subunit